MALNNIVDKINLYIKTNGTDEQNTSTGLRLKEILLDMVAELQDAGAYTPGEIKITLTDGSELGPNWFLCDGTEGTPNLQGRQFINSSSSGEQVFRVGTGFSDWGDLWKVAYPYEDGSFQRPGSFVGSNQVYFKHRSQMPKHDHVAQYRRGALNSGKYDASSNPSIWDSDQVLRDPFNGYQDLGQSHGDYTPGQSYPMYDAPLFFTSFPRNKYQNVAIPRRMSSTSARLVMLDAIAPRHTVLYTGTHKYAKLHKTPFETTNGVQYSDSVYLGTDPVGGGELSPFYENANESYVGKSTVLFQEGENVPIPHLAKSVVVNTFMYKPFLVPEATRANWGTGTNFEYAIINKPNRLLAYVTDWNLSRPELILVDRTPSPVRLVDSRLQLAVPSRATLMELRALDTSVARLTRPAWFTSAVPTAGGMTTFSAPTSEEESPEVPPVGVRALSSDPEDPWVEDYDEEPIDKKPVLSQVKFRGKLFAKLKYTKNPTDSSKKSPIGLVQLVKNETVIVQGEITQNGGVIELPYDFSTLDYTPIVMVASVDEVLDPNLYSGTAVVEWMLKDVELESPTTDGALDFLIETPILPEISRESESVKGDVDPVDPVEKDKYVHGVQFSKGDNVIKVSGTSVITEAVYLNNEGKVITTPYSSPTEIPSLGKDSGKVEFKVKVGLVPGLYENQSSSVRYSGFPTICRVQVFLKDSSAQNFTQTIKDERYEWSGLEKPNTLAEFLTPKVYEFNVDQEIYGTRYIEVKYTWELNLKNTYKTGSYCETSIVKGSVTSTSGTIITEAKQGSGQLKLTQDQGNVPK